MTDPGSWFESAEYKQIRERRRVSRPEETTDEFIVNTLMDGSMGQISRMIMMLSARVRELELTVAKELERAKSWREE